MLCTTFARLPAARLVAVFVALGCGAFAAHPALAHEFNTVLVVPSGPDAQALRKATETAFLIAARERDGHSNETSEGHLGGLDVQLTVLETANASDPAIAGAHFIAAPLMGIEDVSRLSAAAPQAVILSRVDLANPAAAAMLGADQARGLDRYEVRYQRETGGPPGEAAILAYLMARWIDRVIRPLGTADNREAILAALARESGP